MVMKTKLIYVVCIFIFLGCKKDEKICSNLPEGIYEGLFTDNGSSSSNYNSNLEVSIIDDNTVSINALSSSEYTVTRTGCDLNGKVTAIIGSNYKDLDITGKIKRKKSKYVIEGDYTYIGYNGGMGNPSYFDVHGTFEIKPKD